MIKQIKKFVKDLKLEEKQLRNIALTVNNENQLINFCSKQLFKKFVKDNSLTDLDTTINVEIEFNNLIKSKLITNISKLKNILYKINVTNVHVGDNDLDVEFPYRVIDQLNQINEFINNKKFFLKENRHYSTDIPIILIKQYKNHQLIDKSILFNENLLKDQASNDKDHYSIIIDSSLLLDSNTKLIFAYIDTYKVDISNIDKIEFLEYINQIKKIYPTLFPKVVKD